MARFELSITADYAPSWGVWEGIREVIQNGLDSQDCGFPLHVSHEGGYLVVRNEGCVLDTSVWLLGKSSKRGDDSLRGKHGDGLKVGTLALLRSGVEVKIMNGEEIWHPVLEHSENYAGEKVLAIKTRSRRSDRYGYRPASDFTVSVKLDKREWEKIKDRFLDLQNIPDDQIVKVPGRGSMLLDISMVGRIYAKGIYVCTKPDMAYGYNFDSLSLDRDRRMVDDWDLRYEIAQLVARLCSGDDGDAWIATLYNQLCNENTEFDKAPAYASNETQEAMAALFLAQHGEKAVPVANDQEANQVSFYGLHGVVAPRGMLAMLQPVFGDLATILRKAINTSGRYVAPEDMTPEERINWQKAINLLDLADVVDSTYLRSCVKCYEYTAPDAPLGTHHNSEERINRTVVKNLRALLGVMIHELAHDAGRDGTLAHRQAEENMFEKVMGCLLDMAGTDWLLE